MVFTSHDGQGLKKQVVDFTVVRILSTSSRVRRLKESKKRTNDASGDSNPLPSNPAANSKHSLTTLSKQNFSMNHS